MLNNVNSDFKTEQLKAARVKTAYDLKEKTVTQLVRDAELDIKSLHIFIRAVKSSGTLEVFGKDASHDTYTLIKLYKICAKSGTLGPKRKSGDRQVPEGFYTIDRFNPWSTFHLSLGINYPNRSDKKLTPHSDPGGDIFIHGDCVTIGCLPMTDDAIREIYILAVEARNNGQTNIPVHIFPVDLHTTRLNAWIPYYSETNARLWDNLREGYDYFERHKKLPEITVGADGYYDFGG